jgi:hypothetical protein
MVLEFVEEALDQLAIAIEECGERRLAVPDSATAA